MILLSACAGTIPPRPFASPNSAQTPPDLGNFGAVPELLRNLNEARQVRGAAPLRIDHVLSLVAHSAALQYVQLGRGGERMVADTVNQELGRFSAVFSRVSSSVLLTSEVRDAVALLQPALDPSMQLVGVAVESRGALGLAIVVVVGQ